MSLDAIKYVSISRASDQKILVEHIPDKVNKGFSGEFADITNKVISEEAASPASSSKYTLSTNYGKAHILKDANGFIFISVTQSYYPEHSGFLMVEELRQEFFQTYPELMKSPNSNSLFSTDKRYLHEICKKYNAGTSEEDRGLFEARQKIEGTTSAMKNNVVLMMGNQDQAKQLETKASAFASQARQFDENATLIAREFRWRQIKFWLMIGCVTLSFILLLIWWSY